MLKNIKKTILGKKKFSEIFKDLEKLFDRVQIFINSYLLIIKILWGESNKFKKNKAKLCYYPNIHRRFNNMKHHF